MDFEYPPGATPLDPGEAEGLLLPHITTRGELDRWEQENLLAALYWIASTKPAVILDEYFVRQLHRRMFNMVWKWAGRYRRTDKNIGGPWYDVPTSVVSLLADAELWIKLGDESPIDIGVRFHHRLVTIHPFPNGNGRHARLMTDLLLEHRLNAARFSWGDEDLSQRGEARRRYIAALQAADKNDYGPLNPSSSPDLIHQAMAPGQYSESFALVLRVPVLAVLGP